MVLTFHNSGLYLKYIFVFILELKKESSIEYEQEENFNRLTEYEDDTFADDETNSESTEDSEKGNNNLTTLIVIHIHISNKFN